MKNFVDRIVFDNWNGVLCDEEEIIEPEIGDIELIIDKLDANIHTLATFYGGNGSYLSVGGGSGRYVLYVSTFDQQYWNLLSGKSENKVVLLNVGGQVGDFPSKQIIDRGQALQAVRTFFATGEIDLSLQWELQK